MSQTENLGCDSGKKSRCLTETLASQLTSNPPGLSAITLHDHTWWPSRKAERQALAPKEIHTMHEVLVIINDTLPEAGTVNSVALQKYEGAPSEHLLYRTCKSEGPCRMPAASRSKDRPTLEQTRAQRNYTSFVTT